MACCLTAPGHYLSQWRLIISEFLWHSHESDFPRNTIATLRSQWVLSPSTNERGLCYYITVVISSLSRQHYIYVVLHNNQNSSLTLNVRYVNYRETLTSKANNGRHMAKCRSFSTNSRVVMRRRSASFKDYYNRVTDFRCEFFRKIAG